MNLHVHFLLIVFLLIDQQTVAQYLTQTFDQLNSAGMQDRNVPGMITAVYHHKSLVFSKTYGLKNVQKQLPVDPQTIFNLGSATKPFIGIAMGILVEQGKILWNDRVKDHYPDFKLSDFCTTEDARIKDLFLHNLGIASGDLLWSLDSTSTKEMLKRYALAKKIHPIRAGFHYNNLLYVIAGEVIEAVSGQHWTSFVEEQILTPLEMQHSFTRVADVLPYSNYATPYYYLNGQWVAHPLNLADQMGAAGNIWSCLEDLEHFLEFLVNEGSYKEKQIVSAKTFCYLFQAHSLENAPEMDPLHTRLQSNFRNYGIGWFLHDYRGKKVVYHPGSIDGMNAQIGFVPSQKLAFFIMCNRDWAEFWRSLFYKAIDLWVFQDNSNNYPHLVHNPSEKYIRQWETQKAANKNPDAPPKVTTKNLLGTYKNAMLGNAEVLQQNNRLQVIFNNYLRFELEHWFDDFYLGTTIEKFYGWDTYFSFNPGALRVFGETFSKQNQ